MPSAAPAPGPPPTGAGHPDYRFSLANERTLLAWLRTALALVAGGVAIAQFAPGLGVPHGGTVVAVLLLAGGLVTALAGHRRYRRAEAAIAADAPLPDGSMGSWAAATVAVLVVLVGALVVVDALRG
ncbi:DUF202 domain-containing protein [Modestobacter sp. I12A-02628]|uniref:DUF202 domain-containing protein n=1 Tax=Goekera deserti TaxID=2497753 RepID=A0A7K3WJA3_9ACTN|nr:DUF202 domain-containing protein [Goekera deserti]MPQ99303.1 DUF202 domain-containing protein [Goekera deserti]NDI50302.1 DUF202 domain-containing protein [Goekera deserti]NEL56446.1 DUF202 domain-containing protein [Goekera deserti]